jgi:hypothetical protein
MVGRLHSFFTMFIGWVLIEEKGGGAEDIKLPYEVSQYGLITGQMFAINSAISFANGWNILSIYLAIVWATTMLHWRKLQKGGFVRNLDIMCAVSLVIRIAFYDGMKMMRGLQSSPFEWWFVYVASSVLVFVLNEWWFQQLRWNPLTDTPTIAVYVNTFVHLFMMHILPNAVWIYLML